MQNSFSRPNQPLSLVGVFASLITALAITLIGYLVITNGVRLNRSGSDSERLTMVAAAESWIDTLDDVAKEKCLLAYDDAQRVDWHFIPKPTRKGMPLMDMSEPQQTAALALLRSLVSDSGFNKARSVMALEGVLLEIEGPKSKGKRNPQKYYFTVFGTPSDRGLWGIGIEGHHLSLNFSLKGNSIVDSTPQFLASNPAELKNDYQIESHPDFKSGYRVLAAEEQLGFELVNTLSSEQRSKAILSDVAPDEIRWAGESQATNFEPRGIQVSEFNAEQKRILEMLISTYLQLMSAEVAENRMAEIEKDGFDELYFAWAGALQAGIGHYYSVQGKSFIVEFINVQPDANGNPANHVHCVWRDLTGDFNLPIE